MFVRSDGYTRMLRHPLMLALAMAMPAAGQQFTGPYSLEGIHFSAFGRHPNFHLNPGYRQILKGVEGGQSIVMTITTLDQTKEILLPDVGGTRGIVTRVVEEREEVNGALSQVARFFYSRSVETGDVFHFGEEVDHYEAGQISDTVLVWQAGVAEARPGIIMPRTFLLGARYLQSDAPAARDGAENVGIGLAVTTPGGTFTNCVRILETDTLKPELGVATKTYAPGIGLINDDDKLLLHECWLGTTGLPRGGSYVPASNLGHFPLAPGLRLVLEGPEQSSLVTLTMTVSNETRTFAVEVAGELQIIPTRIVEDRLERNGQLVEVSRQFFAQGIETEDVYCLGREVDRITDGVIVGHEGSWQAGVNGARAGVFMPSSSAPGCRHLLFSAPGITNDLAITSAVAVDQLVPAGNFRNCFRRVVSNSTDPGQASFEATYAPGIGLIKRGALELVAVTQPSAGGPTPALGIQEAYLLTWPLTDYYFSLQSSTDLQSWMPVPALPRISDGRNQLTVPRRSEQEYFRLVAP